MIISAEGRVQTEDAYKLKKVIGNYRHSGEKYFVLDLGEVTYLNSYALGMLTHVVQETANKGGIFKLANPLNNVSLLFDMVGLKQFIRVYPSVEKAVASFRQDVKRGDEP